MHSWFSLLFLDAWVSHYQIKISEKMSWSDVCEKTICKYLIILWYLNPATLSNYPLHARCFEYCTWQKCFCPIRINDGNQTAAGAGAAKFRNGDHLVAQTMPKVCSMFWLSPQVSLKLPTLLTFQRSYSRFGGSLACQSDVWECRILWGFSFCGNAVVRVDEWGKTTSVQFVKWDCQMVALAYLQALFVPCCTVWYCISTVNSPKIPCLKCPTYSDPFCCLVCSERWYTWLAELIAVCWLNDLYAFFSNDNKASFVYKMIRYASR